MKTLALVTLLSSLFMPLLAQSLSDYQNTVTGQSPSAYYKLDGTLNDALGGPALTANGTGGGFMPDAYRNATDCYSFLNSDDALIQATDILAGGGSVTNAAAAGNGTISFLFRALDSASNTGQRFLFSQGNTTTNGNALGLFFENVTSTNDPGALKLRVGDGTTSILLSNAIVANSWYYFAASYDETRDSGEVIWYLGPAGGTLSSGTINIANEAVVGDNGTLYIGNQSSLGSSFRSPGRGRIDEFAVWTSELSATQISNQFSKLPAALPTGVSYQALLAAEKPKYYFKLDGSLVDAVGGLLTLSTNGTNGAFTSDVLGHANQAYSFTDNSDALFITNDLINGGGPGMNTSASGVGTISFLFRMLSDTNNTDSRALFAAPLSSANQNQLGLFLESATPTNSSGGDLGNAHALKLRVGNTTKGNLGATDPVPVASPEDLVPNAWYYFAMTYDETRNTPEIYIYFGKVGGSLTNTSFNPANSSVVGDNGTLYLGNRETLTGGFRNPGSGAIDEFAIWHDELSPAEILAQFNAIIASAPAPVLSIAQSGANVLLSWPSNTAPSYVLEATNVLDATTISGATWPSAGTPTVVGTNYVVTNAVTSDKRFFRLHKL